MDLHKGRSKSSKDITLICGCGNLVPASSHTTSSETSVRVLRIDVERDSSVGICLVQLTLNLDQDPLNQHQEPTWNLMRLRPLGL